MSLEKEEKCGIKKEPYFFHNRPCLLNSLPTKNWAVKHPMHMISKYSQQIYSQLMENDWAKNDPIKVTYGSFTQDHIQSDPEYILKMAGISENPIVDNFPIFTETHVGAVLKDSLAPAPGFFKFQNDNLSLDSCIWFIATFYSSLGNYVSQNDSTQ